MSDNVSERGAQHAEPVEACVEFTAPFDRFRVLSSFLSRDFGKALADEHTPCRRQPSPIVTSNAASYEICE